MQMTTIFYRLTTEKKAGIDSASHSACRNSLYSMCCIYPNEKIIVRKMCTSLVVPNLSSRFKAKQNSRFRSNDLVAQTPAALQSVTWCFTTKLITL